MSKSFTKVLTICSLVLVVMAIIVASAICLTTTVSYKVTVDAVLRGIENLPDGANKEVVIKINGKEARKYNAQKGEKITIEYAGLDDYDYAGWMNGQYLETTELSTKLCAFEINADTKISMVFDAHKFYQFNVGYNSDATVTGGKIDVKVEGSDYYGSNGVYQVKDGSEFTVSYTTTGYDFVNWGSEEKTANPYKIESVWGPQTFNAKFNAIKYNVKYGEEAPVSLKYGETLKVLGDEYVESSTNGGYWKTFEGWQFNGKKHDKAVFDVAKENRDIALTANIKDQSQIEYTLKQNGTPLAIFRANQGLELNNENIDKIKGHNELVGFKVGAVEYALNAEKNNFVLEDNVYKNFSKVLADGAATDINVQAVWKLRDEYATTYTINVNTTYGEAGQFTINNEKLTIVKAPARKYYKLTGIKIGEAVLNLKADGKSFEDNDALYAAIAAAQKTEENVLTAEAVWDITVETTIAYGNGDTAKVDAADIDKEGSLVEFLNAVGISAPAKAISVVVYDTELKQEVTYVIENEKFDKCSISYLLDIYEAHTGKAGAEVTIKIII